MAVGDAVVVELRPCVCPDLFTVSNHWTTELGDSDTIRRKAISYYQTLQREFSKTAEARYAHRWTARLKLGIFRGCRDYICDLERE